MTQLAGQLGIVIAGHGSRDADGIREFEALMALVRARAKRWPASRKQTARYANTECKLLALKSRWASRNAHIICKRADC